MKTVRVAIGLVLLLGLAGPAQAVSQRDADACARGVGDRRIAACNRIIDSPRVNARIRAIAYGNRGVAYRRKGELGRAIADYSEAIRLRPGYARVYYNRGLAHRRKGDLDRAIADYSEAIRLRPQYAYAYNSRGFAYRSKGDLDRAIADYSEAIRLDPKYALAYYNRGLAHRRQGDRGRAIADLEKAAGLGHREAKEELRQTETARANGRGSSITCVMGTGDQKIAACNRILGSASASARTRAVAYNNRGLAYRRKGDLDHAIADHSEAIRLNPQYALAYYNRSVAHSRKGDRGRAVADLKKAAGLGHRKAKEELEELR